jgi:hypothetical protein
MLESAGKPGPSPRYFANRRDGLRKAGLLNGLIWYRDALLLAKRDLGVAVVILIICPHSA